MNSNRAFEFGKIRINLLFEKDSIFTFNMKNSFIVGLESQRFD